VVTPRVAALFVVTEGRVQLPVKFGGWEDPDGPPRLAEAFERQGADEVLMRLAPSHGDGTAGVVSAVRVRLSVPLTVSSGPLSVDGAERLLEAGADRVCVPLDSPEGPSLVAALSRIHGPETVVAEVRCDRASATGGLALAAQAGRQGAGEILLEAEHGGDLSALILQARRSGLPVMASGATEVPVQMAAAFAAGASAVAAAAVFHDQPVTLADIKRALKAYGIPVRV
jgi:cyclase